jgi:hypothetical protein
VMFLKLSMFIRSRFILSVSFFNFKGMDFCRVLQIRPVIVCNLLHYFVYLWKMNQTL